MAFERYFHDVGMPTGAPANPIGMWTLDGNHIVGADASSAADLSPTGTDLDQSLGAFDGYTVVGDITGWRTIVGATGDRVQPIGATPESLRLADVDATFEVIAAVSPGTGGYFFSCGGVGESYATNYLYSLGILTATNELYTFWETTGYANVGKTWASALITKSLSTWYYIALVRHAGGFHEIYIDGAFKESATLAVPVKAGSGNVQTLKLFGLNNTYPSNALDGITACVRISDYAADAGQILETYTALTGPPFSITEKIPADGDTGVAKDTDISFKMALSNPSLLSSTTVYVQNTPVYIGASGNLVEGWKKSSIIQVSNDFYFSLSPDRFKYFREEDVVTVKVVVSGYSEEWSFTPAGPAFSYKTSRMLLKSLLKVDE